MPLSFGASAASDSAQLEAEPGCTKASARSSPVAYLLSQRIAAFREMGSRRLDPVHPDGRTPKGFRTPHSGVSFIVSPVPMDARTIVDPAGKLRGPRLATGAGPRILHAAYQ